MTDQWSTAQREKLAAAAKRIRLAPANSDRTDPHEDMPDDDFLGAATATESAAVPRRERRARTVADVIADWRSEGQLLVIGSGLAPLDEATRGGFVVGRTYGLQGSPDACKTALVSWLGRRFAEAGFVVGMHAVDEDDEDLVPRFGQMLGHERDTIERREAGALDALDADLRSLALRFYDATWTVEDVAEDLAAWRDSQGARGAVMLSDSLQVIRCAASTAAETERAIVSANVRALKEAARAHRLLSVFTSEMNRGAYRSEDAAETSNDMAAGKESGAIEYGAKGLFTLRSVKDRPDLIELRVTKNKRGPSYPRLPAIRLRFDRGTHRFHVDDSPTLTPEEIASERTAARLATRARQAGNDAEALIRFVVERPDLTERALREGACAKLGWGTQRFNAAKATAQDAADGYRLTNAGTERAAKWRAERLGGHAS